MFFGTKEEIVLALTRYGFRSKKLPLSVKTPVPKFTDQKSFGKYFRGVCYLILNEKADKLKKKSKKEYCISKVSHAQEKRIYFLGQ